MKVKLYGILRDKLPRENKGQSELDLPPQSTLQDLLNTLQITTMVKASVNDELERDLQRELQEGDDIQLFRPVGGG